MIYKDHMTDLAHRIIETSKADIFLWSRFFMLAISYFKPKIPDDPSVIGNTIGADGQNLYFDPMWVVKSFNDSPSLVRRTLVHVALHGIFKHHLKKRKIAHPAAWDCACDIAVESILDDLELSNLTISDVAKRETTYRSLEKDLPLLSAESIYRNILLLDLKEIEELHAPFVRDHHGLWDFKYLSTPSDNQQDSDPEDTDSDNDHADDETNNSEVLQHARMIMQEENAWIDIAKKTELAFDIFDKRIGKSRGSFLKMLKIEYRRRDDYKHILKSFLALKETMKIDMDAFDYITYTYGLSLYGNMPLIEYLEYKDEHTLEDLVIVIDTSGSTYDLLVKRFLEETYMIISATADDKRRFNLYILQADADVQDVVYINSMQAFKSYMEKLVIKGGGGTDFRPAFEHVNDMLKQGVLTRLKGLIYFTDGCGTYPISKPDYETVFIFYDEEGNDYDIPSWAIKVIVGEENFR